MSEITSVSKNKTLNVLLLDTELSWGYGRYFTYETGFSETINDFFKDTEIILLMRQDF